MSEFFRKPLLACWERLLLPNAQELYFKQLALAINERRMSGARIIPSDDDALKIFRILPLENVKVVIIGQDPYPNINSATGLAFGIPKGCKLPPTLVNICNEVERNLNEPVNFQRCVSVLSDMENGVISKSEGLAKIESLTEEDEKRPKITLDRTNLTLEGWTKQGVLLLNSVLTTEDGVVGAHEGLGWEQFTDNVIFALSQSLKPISFLLWGVAAEKKIAKIKRNGGIGVNNQVLIASHPSPLSYNRGPLEKRFQGCGHFTRANQWLMMKKLTPIDWSKTGA